MSVYSQVPSTKRTSLFKLDGASNYRRWKSQLQDHMFRKVHNTNMDTLTMAKTLDSKFFKKEFSMEYKAASKDSAGVEVDPMDDEGFVKLCSASALKTGVGFEPWLYDMYADVRAALSDKIQDQTAGVARGNLVGLLAGIKLSIHYHEVYDHDDLEMEYTQSNMSDHGDNDLMTYLGLLRSYMNRLANVGKPIPDSKSQRVLLKGVDQDVFEGFIIAEEQNHYVNYDSLENAIQKHATKPRISKKLRALKPGTTQTTLVTRAKRLQQQPPPGQDGSQQAEPSPASKRMARLEQMFVAMTDKPAPNKRKREGSSICHQFATRGNCSFGDNCRYTHGATPGTGTSRRKHDSGANDAKDEDLDPAVYCLHHRTSNHSTFKCNTILNKPKLKAAYGPILQGRERVNTTFAGFFVMRVSLPQHVIAMRGSDNGRKDRWCVDGAATTHGTWDRSKCFDIEPCNVQIIGPRSSDKTFTCTEMGSVAIDTYDADTGITTQILATKVLISEEFPFHIFSEIIAYKKKCTATKAESSWTFRASSGKKLFHASQPFLEQENELYFIDGPPTERALPANTRQHVGKAADYAMVTTQQTAEQADASPELAQATKLPKVDTAKNLRSLLELHVALDHRNFRDVAAQFGLRLPVPVPDCWACLMAKPRSIAHDKVSTRQTSRPLEGFAADAKGPMANETPEGYRYFFLIVCLYSYYHWSILAKSQADWKIIWPRFVKRAEASTGKERCVSFLITDGHKVHVQESIKTFNADRGVVDITTAPYSQWQDPAERGIQTVARGARASLIHGGGKPFMWGWAVQHTTDSINILHPSEPVKGHEGKSRQQILRPATTKEQELRRHRPFLCLAMMTVPNVHQRSDFKPRAEPCVLMRYDRTRKSFILLSVPNLYLKYSVEVKFVAMVFPLRVTNMLSRQLDTFLRPTAEDEVYADIHGPANILRRTHGAIPNTDQGALAQEAPVEVRPSRGYHPSAAGLESVAYLAPTSTATLFTPDQLAARTPRNTKQALTGPDKDFWLPAVLKDHAVVRKMKCIINVTDQRPPGPPPPPIEQRFKIKYHGTEPIALADLLEKAWKARTVARGDRFKHGVHYDATSAPVVLTPALKILVAWGVERGLLPFEWDQYAAFYGNRMDRTGVIVRLAAGYDPYSENLRPLHLPPLYGELAGGLPGIPQGALIHYDGFVPSLKDQGFSPINADMCIFMHSSGDMATSLHVDDGVLFAPSLAHAEAVLGKAGLGKTRTLTWGPLQHTLGVDFNVVYTPERRSIFMSQRSYAVTILERAGMLDANPVLTPAIPGRKYTKDDCPASDEERNELAAQGMTKEWYHSIVASLNFLVTITRDDMRFIQGKVAKFCADPGPEHFKALKHELRYLKGTLGYGVEFVWRASDPAPSDGPINIEAWSDSSFADDVDTARTTMGGVIKVNGATVSAYSKLSQRVDSCVNHSELHAFGSTLGGQLAAEDTPDDQPTDGASSAFLRTSRDVTWVRGVKAALERRDERKIKPTPIYVDNAGVLSMLEGKTMKPANKHIYRTLAENRERVQLDRTAVPVKVDTKVNLANALTKQEHGLKESAAQLRLITGPPSTATA